jgi:hypothetical protein
MAGQISYPPTLCNGDMLQEQDDRSHGDFRRKRRDERTVDIGGTNALEPPGNALEDLDWICALFGLTMTDVQP